MGRSAPCVSKSVDPMMSVSMPVVWKRRDPEPGSSLKVREVLAQLLLFLLLLWLTSGICPTEIPVEIIRPPQDVFEPPGSDVVFEVELNKDRVEVKWLRNNMPVVQGDKHQMMSEGKVHRLQVCEIRPRDQGEYRIIAKDKDAKAKLELAGKSVLNMQEHNRLLTAAS